ncbi:N-acetyltransferase GCN5 [Myriangium duriaei CBS 260.36]|uniref:N-acetyltransferase GCN5 n=1 Tax=Myriangium duriaei CBS 260.36 TaxID=1168546 RepID=A0A9P4ITD3_9PEZI|nr:N-acetyltransferase GCN5 [Myriangium duriaei CBS 260.36]
MAHRSLNASSATAASSQQSPILSVAPATGPLRSKVLALNVLPDQAVFVDSMAVVLKSIDDDPFSEPMAILTNETSSSYHEAVGFYRLDARQDAIGERDFGPGTVGLRAFLIDARHQGKGYAGAAITALAGDLRLRRPEVRRVALSVNLRNERAQRLYERCGFVAESELYYGGSSGPQTVMILTL